MAGKTKKSANRPSTPKYATPRVEAPEKVKFGHMGLKSSPFAPTDCKLVNQYMVLDRMQAHYKKLNKTRAAIDTSTPKSWLVSQKLRDQARRDHAQNQSVKSARTPGRYGHTRTRHDSLASEDDRVEMFAMMESQMENGLDDLDGYAGAKRSNTSLEMHYSNSSSAPTRLNRNEMMFVDKMVNDNERSPSNYFSGKTYSSNIPDRKVRSVAPNTRVVAQKALYKTQLLDSYQSNVPLGILRSKSASARGSGDVLDQNAYKFTEEKPFQPRTLKTDRKSKLSDFKCYTAPKRKGGDGNASARGDDVDGGTMVRPDTGQSAPAVSMRASLRSRPGTANTLNSTDWMNETIISRDHTHRDTPQGVPALDISLDQDHIKWLKEQQSKAQLRTSVKSPRHSATRGPELADTRRLQTLGQSSHLGTFTLHDSHHISGYYERQTSRDLEEEEEELKYLQFIQEVTNDVLDRNIFTNRVLRVVFESHVERRKHQLKVSKMREMLEDLRVDLGIPATDSEEDPQGLGLTSTWSPTHQTLPLRAGRRFNDDAPHFAHTSKSSMHSKASPPQQRRTLSPDGKPPIPRPGSSGAGGAGGKAPAGPAQHQSVETATEGGNRKAGSADVLTISHEDTEQDDFLNTDTLMNSTLKGANSTVGSGDEQDQAALYERQLANTLDDADTDTFTGSEASLRHQAELPEDSTALDPSRTTNQTACTNDSPAGAKTANMATSIRETGSSGTKPTPRERRRKGNEVKDTPRSQERDNTTSDTIDVSELDDDYDTF